MGKKVRDVMTQQPSCVTFDTPVMEAAKLMASEDVGAIPVLEGKRVSAIVTDRDIVLRAVAQGKDPSQLSVRDVSSEQLVTVKPDEDLSEALKLMATNQVRRLPVVEDDNRLVGVVSQADLALQAREQSVGAMVEAISEPGQGQR